jgi:hypothetical protein
MNNCKLPNRCPTKNRHKNNPVKAIQYFLASEDFINTDLLMMLFFSSKNDGAKIKTKWV